MTSRGTKKHIKHTKLTKPFGGKYHATEWGIIGAPCTIIQNLANKIGTVLDNDFRIGFLDAAHQSPERADLFSVYYMDNISHQTVNFDLKPTPLENRKFFADLHCLLINGNHFIADKQIVIINDQKKDSLQRKLDRLTNVRLVLLENNDQTIYDFLKPYLSDDVVMKSIDDVSGICKVIKSEMRIPNLKGLVLAGGKSQRMGTDKSQLEYYGKPHSIYTGELIDTHCQETFLSLGNKTKDVTKSRFSTIIDSFAGLGPFGAILSAFRQYPNHAWLTVACDLPYINQALIDQLVSKRNPNKLATCFHNQETKFPEPLITIWEPRAYPVLLEYLSQGYSCPRKVLINSQVEELELENQQWLVNANDNSSYLKAVEEISKNQMK